MYTEEETVSVHETNAQHFKIYPNPSRDEIYLIDNQASANDRPIAYQIFNQLGGLVLSGTYDGKINIGPLSTGIYFLRYSGESSGCEKFIKQ
ncbi:MAG: T9SS type A sorting domain-containing protein [Saprospiraceae bacterium]|nr:T9SS type A sorting domain-containing protein [Saprospiraceae bacterium]